MGPGRDHTHRNPRAGQRLRRTRRRARFTRRKPQLTASGCGSGQAEADLDNVDRERRGRGFPGCGPRSRIRRCRVGGTTRPSRPRHPRRGRAASTRSPSGSRTRHGTIPLVFTSTAAMFARPAQCPLVATTALTPRYRSVDRWTARSGSPVQASSCRVSGSETMQEHPHRGLRDEDDREPGAARVTREAIDEGLPGDLVVGVEPSYLDHFVGHGKAMTGGRRGGREASGAGLKAPLPVSLVVNPAGTTNPTSAHCDRVHPRSPRAPARGGTPARSQDCRSRWDSSAMSCKLPPCSR